jgi:hypothetical protein
LICLSEQFIAINKKLKARSGKVFNRFPPLAKEKIDVFHEEKNLDGDVADLRVSRQDRSGGSVGRAQGVGHPEETGSSGGV